MIHHGITHTGGHVKHGTESGSANGRVAHGVHGSGSVSSHAGMSPRIVDSGAKAFNDLSKARGKSHTSKHEVRVHGGKFSGRVKHGR
jgi:hypothetical protein